MIPFLFLHMAPQCHFRLDGAVSQAIDPDIAWFQKLIRPGAGHARLTQALERWNACPAVLRALETRAAQVAQ